MSFTRKMLAAMGIESDKADEIITAHLSVVNGLKDERDQLKESVSKLEETVTKFEEVQKELDNLKKVGGDWQAKYETEHNAFEEYKVNVQAAEIRRVKENAYRDAMKKAGIPDKMLDPLLRIAKIDDAKVQDGVVTNVSDIEANVKNEFSDYIRVEKTALDTPDNPPANATGKDAFNAMTLTEQMRYANEHPAEAAEYLKGV
jgi:uncharacterized protein YpuA (DUF1002 family)